MGGVPDTAPVAGRAYPMTARQLRIIELRGKLMGWLSAKERDRLLAELARLVKAEAGGP